MWLFTFTNRVMCMYFYFQNWSDLSCSCHHTRFIIITFVIRMTLRNQTFLFLNFSGKTITSYKYTQIFLLSIRTSLQAVKLIWINNDNNETEYHNHWLWLNLEYIHWIGSLSFNRYDQRNILISSFNPCFILSVLLLFVNPTKFYKTFAIWFTFKILNLFFYNNHGQKYIRNI